MILRAGEQSRNRRDDRSHAKAGEEGAGTEEAELSLGLAMGFAPDDAEDVRSGMPTSGIRITSPRSTATGAAALPPRSSPTGSALIARMRPIGVPLGIAVLLAVSGSPRSAGATGDACEHASYIIAGLAPVAGSIALALLARRSGAREARAANAVGVEVRP